MNLPWQVLTDCGRCQTTASVVELLDPTHPACHLGVPARATCRMCGHDVLARPSDRIPAHPIGSRRCPSCAEAVSDASLDARRCLACGWEPELEVAPGIDPRDPHQARIALERWAREEGLTLEDLCTELGGSPDVLVARYAAGEPVDSGMDVVAFLFPGMAAGGGAQRAAEAPVRPAPVKPAPLPADPRAAARLLASVMVADGELRVGERAFVEAWLKREGQPALDPAELRPWRPHELGPIGDPALAARAVEAAVELMHLDGQRDGSELRIVRTFARVWGVPEAEVDRWNATYDRRHTPPVAVVWRALSRWVRTR